MNFLKIFILVVGIILDGSFIYLDSKKQGSLSIFLKTSASLMFVILAFLNKNEVLDYYLVIALTLDMLGDFVLILRNVYPKYHDLIYVVGTLIFLLGHIMFSVYLLKTDETCLVKGLIINILMFVILGLYLVRLLKVNSAMMKIIGLIYILIIMFTSGLAIARMLNEINFTNGYFMLATLIFMFSDVILVINKYDAKAPKYTQPLYRIMYYLSQVLFAIYVGF